MDEASYDRYLQETGDWLKTARSKLLGQLVERHRGATRGLELLEVGAGAGQNLDTLARFGRVDAIEINPLGREAIAARQVARDVFAEPVPFELDRRYDVVCALDVIEHLADAEKAVRWMAGMLRPGGILVLTVPAYQWLYSDHDRALGHHRRYTRSSLLATLPAGLEVRAAAYFTHLVFPLAVAARLAWSLRRIGSREPPAKQPSPRDGWAARMLARVQDVELAMIARGYRPAFGLSAFVVAELPRVAP